MLYSNIIFMSLVIYILDDVKSIVLTFRKGSRIFSISITNITYRLNALVPSRNISIVQVHDMGEGKIKVITCKKNGK